MEMTIIPTRLRFFIYCIFIFAIFSCNKQSTTPDKSLGTIKLPDSLTGTLAYARHKKHKNWGIVLVDLKSGKKELIPNQYYKDFEWIGGLDLSRDFSKVICHIKTGDKKYKLAWIDIKTGKVNILPDTTTEALYPKYSSDDKKIIYYIAPEFNKKNIVIADSNGENKIVLPCPVNNCLHPTWINSDKNSFVYLQYHKYNYPETESIAISVGGKIKFNYKNLSRVGYHLHMPKIIPNTNMVSYLQTQNGTFFNESNVYLIDKKESKQLIFHSEKKISSYDWLGRSDYVAFTEVNELSPSTGIYVVNTNTKKRIKISDDDYFALGPVWSPNNLNKSRE